MCEFNLKSMLSMSTSSKRVLHHHKRFKLGKFYYAVQYDLIGTKLIIKNLKKTKRTPKVERSIRRRSERLNQLHRSYMSTTSNASSDPSTCTTVISVLHTKDAMTEPFDECAQIICNDCATQTDEQAAIQQRNVSSDCSDLILHRARSQQTTYNLIEKCLQTDKPSFISTSVQAKCYMTNIFTNTDMHTRMASTQTERYASHCYVQTEDDCDYEQFEHAKPKTLLFKIFSHLITQSNLLQNNNRLTEQLLELRQLDNIRFQIQRADMQAQKEDTKEDTKAPPKPEKMETNKTRATPKFKLSQRTKVVRIVQKHIQAPLQQSTIAEIFDKCTQTDVEQSENSTQTLKKRGFCWRSKEPKCD